MSALNFDFDDFEEYAKKRMKKIIRRGETPIVVAGFVDYFGDAYVLLCDRCGVPVFVRPWLAEAVTQHNWKVICTICADPLDVEGQIAADLSKIETTVKRIKGNG